MKHQTFFLNSFLRMNTPTKELELLMSYFVCKYKTSVGPLKRCYQVYSASAASQTYAEAIILVSVQLLQK